MAHFEVPEFKIKFSDVFSLRNLYLMLHQTLLEEGWYGEDGEKDGSDVEKFYSENVFQKGIYRGGKEIWFWWRTAKDWEGKNSSYFNYKLERNRLVFHYCRGCVLWTKILYLQCLFYHFQSFPCSNRG